MAQDSKIRETVNLYNEWHDMKGIPFYPASALVFKPLMMTLGLFMLPSFYKEAGDALKTSQPKQP